MMKMKIGLGLLLFFVSPSFVWAADPITLKELEAQCDTLTKKGEFEYGAIAGEVMRASHSSLPIEFPLPKPGVPLSEQKPVPYVPPPSVYDISLFNTNIYEKYSHVNVRRWIKGDDLDYLKNLGIQEGAIYGACGRTLDQPKPSPKARQLPYYEVDDVKTIQPIKPF